MSRYKVEPLVRRALALSSQLTRPVGRGHPRRLLRYGHHRRLYAFSPYLPPSSIPLLRHTSRLASDHLYPDCSLVLLSHHDLPWLFQLFRAKRDQPGERHDTEYDRYLSDSRDLGGELGSRLGDTRLALFSVAVCRVRDAGVSSNGPDET